MREFLLSVRNLLFTSYVWHLSGKLERACDVKNSRVTAVFIDN